MRSILAASLCLVLLNACGSAEPKLCPVSPTLCGPTEHYGPACLTYDEYKAAGWDTTAAAGKCHLAVVARFARTR